MIFQEWPSNMALQHVDANPTRHGRMHTLMPETDHCNRQLVARVPTYAYTFSNGPYSR